MPNQNFASWHEFENWLAAKGLFHIELGLTRVKRSLADCGLARTSCLCAQVLGTNGKGSTSMYLAALAGVNGYQTGLFLSPHFLTPRERILVNGHMLTEAEWLAGTRKLARLTDIDALTYFEFLTILSALLFREAGVEIAVFEAGLGGRNDATSAISMSCHCFTPIAMDHARIIGPGLREIAEDKTEAIQPHTLVFSAPQSPLAAEIIRQTASSRHCTVYFAQPFDAVQKTDHQKINAGVAAAAWRALARDACLIHDPEHELAALRKAFLPGRQQRIKASQEHPEMLLDVAHNPHAIATLCRSCEMQPKTIIYSGLEDKNWRACIRLLLGLSENLVIPQIDNYRAASATELMEYANSLKPHTSVAVSNLKEALSRANAGLTLLCGSFYLLCDFYRLHPQYLERNENAGLTAT